MALKVGECEVQESAPYYTMSQVQSRYQEFPILGYTGQKFPMEKSFAMTKREYQEESIRSRLGIDLNGRLFPLAILWSNL